MPKRTTKRPRVVVIGGGVDTHGRTHHTAVIDQQGQLLGDREFPADSGGYRQPLGWLRGHGNLATVGVEGTGSYGAGLTRFLLDRGVNVVEVDRPDRRTRRQRGKSDPVDAEAAARAVVAGTATAPAKRRDGIVESIRALRAARSGATRGPDCRDQPAQRSTGHRAGIAAGGAGRPLHSGVGRRLRPVAPRRDRPGRSGRRHQGGAAGGRLPHPPARGEIGVADQRLAKLVGRAAPRRLKLQAIGIEHAGQLLTTAGRPRPGWDPPLGWP